MCLELIKKAIYCSWLFFVNVVSTTPICVDITTHYLLYAKTSQEKGYKQSDTGFWLSFLLFFHMVCFVLLSFWPMI